MSEVLGRLALKYGFDSDTSLAKHLGVSRQTVGNWRTRESLDFDLILAKFPDADLNWLFRGQDFLTTAAGELRDKGLRMILEPLPGPQAPAEPLGEAGSPP